jgi:hypothetical protein
MPPEPTRLAIDRKRQARYWADPSVYATTLLLLYRDTFGDDRDPVNDHRSALDWDPRTILQEIQETFGVTPALLNYDRLLAALQLVRSNDFYTDPADFVMYCNVLAGTPLNPATFDPADSLEIAWGITEAMIIGPSADPEPFSPEVRGYIGHVLSDEGLLTPPDVLRIALHGQVQNLIQVQAAFADDPDLMGSIYAVAQEHTGDIDTAIKSNLLALAAQLDSLELRNGDARRLAGLMTRSLAGQLGSA